MVAACLENAYSYPHPNFRACHKSLNRQNFVSEIPHFVWEKQKTKCCCPNPPTLWRKNNKILLPKSSYSAEKKQQHFVAKILLLHGEKTTKFCCPNPPSPWRKNNKICCSNPPPPLCGKTNLPIGILVYVSLHFGSNNSNTMTWSCE